jgi:hypothetical protein
MENVIYSREQLEALEASSLQIALEDVVENRNFQGKYGNLYGKLILSYVEKTLLSSGVYSLHTDFEIDFIIKDRIIERLLTNAFYYDKDKMSAKTFVTMIFANELSDAKKAVNRFRTHRTEGVFSYIDEMKHFDREEETDGLAFMENPEKIIKAKK